MSICAFTLGLSFVFGDIRPLGHAQTDCTHCTHSTHYSLFASFTLWHEHPFSGCLCTTNAVSSTFDFKGVICTVRPSLSCSLSLNVFFFSLHGSSGSSVHYVLGKQPGQNEREREGKLQSAKTWKQFPFHFAARTCHCPALTCPIQLACNGQKKRRKGRERAKTACNH